MTLPIEVVEVLKRAASHPEGAAALLEGNLESAASLYQVHPTRVEQVRGWLSNAALHRESEAILSATHPERPPAAPARARKTAPAVIAEAMAMRTEGANGLELLRCAPVETVATLLGAHPFVVDEARALLEVSQVPAAAIPAARPSSPSFAGRPS